MSTARPLRIGVLMFDGAHALDVVAMVTVLRRWADSARSRPDVVTFSTDGVGVCLHDGLLMVPGTSAAELGPLHVLVHPGGPGALHLAGDSEHLDRLHRWRATVPLLVALSEATVPFAAAGLLAGRPSSATGPTAEALVLADPSAAVDTLSRLVDDGDVVTARGLTAGLDTALHLIRRLDAPGTAEGVAADLGYLPSSITR